MSLFRCVAPRLTALLLACCALGQAPLARAGAFIYVATTQQGVTDGTNCSLQEAIYSAEFRTNRAIVSTDPNSYYTTGCVPGTGAGDTIVLPSRATFGFTQFWDGGENNIYGPTVTPLIFTSIVIEANGSTLQWNGAGYSRLFTIAALNVAGFGAGTGSLTLHNAYVRGFHVHGGNGGFPGGGGGLGAGGAIFLGPGAGLYVRNSTFAGNSAMGGCGRNGSGADGHRR